MAPGAFCGACRSLRIWCMVWRTMLAGLMIDAEAFPGWEDFAALLSHLKFVRAHHRRIKKVAASSDSAMLKFMPRIAAPFVSAERSAARDWLRAAAVDAGRDAGRGVERRRDKPRR